MKIWAFCVFMPQKLQDMSSFLGFGGNSALLQYSGSKRHDAQAYANYIARVGFNLLKKDTFYDPEYQGKRSINKYEYQSRKVNKVIEADNVAA